MNKTSYFETVVILILSFLFLLLLGVSFETKRFYEQEVYELRTEVRKLEFELSEATWQIELNNKEREAE